MSPDYQAFVKITTLVVALPYLTRKKGVVSSHLVGDNSRK